MSERAFTDVRKWWIWQLAPAKWIASSPVILGNDTRQESRICPTHAEALAHMVKHSKVTS